MISGISPFGQSDYNVMQFIADDYWSESNPNPNAKYPRLGLTSSQTANNTVASTYWMRNGNFIRFKTLELGYKFKYGRVYLNGDNIAVFSPFKLWDRNYHGMLILCSVHSTSEYNLISNI